MSLCTKRAPNVREFWLFGLKGKERFEASRCRRRAGHRGECTRFPIEAKVINGEVHYVGASARILKDLTLSFERQRNNN